MSALAASARRLRLPQRTLALLILPIAISVLGGCVRGDQSQSPSISSPRENPVGPDSSTEPPRTTARSLGWLDLLVSFLGGGFVATLLPVVSRHILDLASRKVTARATAREVVNKHLDPILKASDELFGKLRSLAQDDFRSLRDENEDRFPAQVRLANILFLFAHLWARFEILRREGLYVNLNKDDRGMVLKAFVDCLESTRVRVVDRAWQRAIGEALVVTKDSGLDTLPFQEFVDRYIGSNDLKRWFSPLEQIVRQHRHTRHRQRLLQYGVVIHALLDKLDPDHHTTKARPSYGNKLTNRTRRDLRYRVFKTYLPFVNNPVKYLRG